MREGFRPSPGCPRFLSKVVLDGTSASCSQLVPELQTYLPCLLSDIPKGLEQKSMPSVKKQCLAVDFGATMADFGRVEGAFPEETEKTA